MAGFLGASALLLDCHRPEGKTRVQSLNDRHAELVAEVQLPLAS